MKLMSPSEIEKAVYKAYESAFTKFSEWLQHRGLLRDDEDVEKLVKAYLDEKTKKEVKE